LRQRLPVYPEFIEQTSTNGNLLAERVSSAADAAGYAQNQTKRAA
jgi:hypothetical protein